MDQLDVSDFWGACNRRNHIEGQGRVWQRVDVRVDSGQLKIYSSTLSYLINCNALVFEVDLMLKYSTMNVFKLLPDKNSTDCLLSPIPG